MNQILAIWGDIEMNKPKKYKWIVEVEVEGKTHFIQGTSNSLDTKSGALHDRKRKQMVEDIVAGQYYMKLNKRSILSFFRKKKIRTANVKVVRMSRVKSK